MKSAAVAVLGALFVIACSDGSLSPGDAGAGGRTGGDAGAGGAGGAAAADGCACVKQGGDSAPAMLSAPWDCYCATAPQHCATTAAQAMAAAQANTYRCYAAAEYPACGLTVLYSTMGLYPWSADVFDAATGAIVGLAYANDSPVACPTSGEFSNANSFSTGRQPDCPATSCRVFGNCSITTTP